MELTLPCIKGNAKLRIGTTRFRRGAVEVLTGKRRRWDGLSWSLLDSRRVAICGLWRGRYADAIVQADVLVVALAHLGATATADLIERATRDA